MNLLEKISWRVRNIYFAKIKKRYLALKDKWVIPPYEEKRQINLGYKKQFGLDTFIETGTFLGDTIEQFKHDFSKLISFELSKELAVKAKNRFNKDQHITIIQGDSGALLPLVLEAINEPCLFWLDGHYSSEFFIGEEYIVTAKGDKNTPVIEELQAILAHPIKGHVILIDDARCFNGKNDYPTVRDIKNVISSFGNKAAVTVKRDIIRITPAVQG
ncbi:hypothetical protein BH11BAC3_BH11BAC3_19450 [soil metagenome]